MSETNGIKETAKPKTDAPILQLNRLNYVKIGGRVLDSTEKNSINISNTRANE